MNEKKKNEIFTYLDGLRESGITNMFGAGEYIRMFFPMSVKESHTVLSEWMSSKRPSKDNGGGS